MVDINSSALASVAFDFPNKVIGLVSVSTSNANVRMAGAQISGTNGAVTMLYCDGVYRITVTFVGVGY